MNFINMKQSHCTVWCFNLKIASLPNFFSGYLYMKIVQKKNFSRNCSGQNFLGGVKVGWWGVDQNQFSASISHIWWARNFIFRVSVIVSYVGMSKKLFSRKSFVRGDMEGVGWGDGKSWTFHKLTMSDTYGVVRIFWHLYRNLREKWPMGYSNPKKS